MSLWARWLCQLFLKLASLVKRFRSVKASMTRARIVPDYVKALSELVTAALLLSYLHNHACNMLEGLPLPGAFRSLEEYMRSGRIYEVKLIYLGRMLYLGTAMNALEAEGLVKRFGNVEALRGVSLEARKGELLVLAGPNGAGKTTTVRIFTTNLRPDAGEARVLGYDVVREYREVRRRIAYIPQGFEPFWEHTPEEYVTAVLMMRGWSFWEARAQAKRWLDALGLSDARRPIRVLSGGQVRRAVVAAVLATEAEVLFLDEPTEGLDVEVRREVWRALRERLRDGSSILMTTHDMGEAEVVADRVALINSGVVLCQESPRALVEKVPYRYRAVVKKGSPLPADAVDLGDRAIVYFRSRSELGEFVSSLSDPGLLVSAGSVGLEDAYLFLLRGGGR